MNFLTPAALWALPAAVLPTLIHLLSRRARRRVEFSDLALLSSVEARLRPRARLRDLLLLAVRTALILFLVLAAAGPVSRGGAAAGRGDGLDLAILFDESYSMRAVQDGRTRFERAREAGRRLLRRLGSGDRVAVAGFDDRTPVFSAWTDAAAADAALAAAAPGWRGSDAARAVAAARTLLSRSPRGRRRALVVLGDGAAHMFAAGPVGPAPDGETDIGLRMPALPNRWIEDARLAPDALSLEAFVRSSGAPAAAPLEAHFGVGRASTARASGVGDRARASVPLPEPEDPRDPRWSGRLVLPPDALSQDGSYYFSARRKPSPPVLVLLCDPDGERAGRAGWFLRRVFGRADATLAGRRADERPAALWRDADWSAYGAVLLADAENLPAGLSAALEEFAARGGSVLVAPGENARPEDFARLSGWLPARLERFETAPAGLRFAPSLAGFELGKVEFSRRVRLTPAPGARVDLAASDGAPMLVSGRVGRGRAAVWGAPLDADGSNLALKPMFPAWTRLLLDAGLPEIAASPTRQAFVGEPLARVWSADEAAPDRVRVRLPDGRHTTLPVRGRRALLPSADEPGLYRFEEPGGADAVFAVNLDARRGESDLTPAPRPPWTPAAPEDLDAVFLAAVYGVDRRGLCLWLAALALALEMLLSAPSRAAKTRVGAALACALALAALPAAPARAQQADRFVWTQWRWGPDWDPDAQAPRRLLTALAEETSVRVLPERRVIDLDDPALFSSPFLYLTGAGLPAELDDSRLRRLRQYLAAGGFLWIEDASGGPPAAFDRWARALAAKALPGAPLTPLPDDHVVDRTFFLLRRAEGCSDAEPALEAASLGGRLALVYSRADAMSAWAEDALGHPLTPCGDQRRRELARRLTINIVMYSLTGSYKADAVHQALILSKLREAGP